MIDLQKSREEIDRIDKQIVDLFEHRMRVAKDVAEYKRNTGKSVLDKSREQQKLQSVGELASSEFTRHGIQELFTQIMSMSRKLQYTLLSEESSSENLLKMDLLPSDQLTKVVYFGVSGSYSEQAMEACFGTNVQTFSALTFREVMSAVKAGSAEFGVLPIENTTTGGITDIYDLLVEFDNFIIAEHILKVEQALLGLPDAEIDDIQTVYSHQQGILQSRMFLSQYPIMKTVETGSTSGCAKKVLEDGDKTQAAIAGIRAAKTYGLKVLAEHINHESSNSTRFIVIANNQNYLKQANKMSICFSLPHASGTLYNMLSHMIYNNLNMTKIESRPLQGKNFEYRFFVDFEGNIEEAGVQNALYGIQAEALDMKILGNYSTI